MSNTPLDLDPAVARLIQEGYYLTLLPSHVVINNVPYITPAGDVADGRLIITVTISGEEISLGDHQIEFMGQFPCTATGEKMINLLTETVTNNRLSESIESNYRFSNHPTDGEILDDCYKKYKHYESLICREAQVINPTATARVLAFRPPDRIGETVFRYADTNAGRAGIVEQTNRFRGHKVGIIGLGGTGSYILDLVAKTSVAEVHLFDNDLYENHNAFRAPGAATVDDLKQSQTKVSYYYKKYDVMRTGIYPHEYHVTSGNVHELDGLDFVFICVDSGPSRKIIAEHLHATGIAFIDTGIELTNRPDGNLLEATTRTTLIAKDAPADAMDLLPFGDISDDLYATNIQIAEVNARNACEAVMQWKKYAEFYADDTPDRYQAMYFSQDDRIIK